MKNKGFTLVELLVAITILGVITGISIPLIRNIQSKNVDKKFTTYGTSVLQTAKLYNDAYYMDMFGKDPTGCAIVDYDTLETKQALKDIDMPDVSCNSKQTLVKIVKMGDKYNYQWKIGCGAEEGNKAKDVTIVYPKENKNIDFECTGNGSSIMDITANPDNEKEYKKKEVTTKLSILSNTGISEDLSISYSWQKHKNYSSVTDWKLLKFKVPPTEKQIQEILEGDLEPIQTNQKIKTPTGGSGSYYLLIKIDKLKDALGKTWADQTATGGKFKSFGPFQIDNEKPTISDIKIKSINGGFNSNLVKVNFKAEDTYSKGNNLKVCVSTTNTCNSYVPYEEYDFNKEIKLADSLNGQSKKVYIFAKDRAGNSTMQDASYTIYKECSKTKDGSNWIDASTCSKKCGGGTKTQKKNLVDIHTNKACSGTSSTTQTVSCNTMGCCSKTTKSNGSWSRWSTCSKKCGGGTHTRSRKVTYKSAYDNSTCKTETEKSSAKCNTMGCCSKTTKVNGSWSSWSTCSKSCGGGTHTRSRKVTYKSAYNNTVCKKDTEKDSGKCNTMGCCSKTTTKCGSYGSCSKSCGGGSKSRTCTKYSSYNGNRCSSYKDSDSCNTHSCCSKKTKVSTTTSSRPSSCSWEGNGNRHRGGTGRCMCKYKVTTKWKSAYNGSSCSSTTSYTTKQVSGHACS